MKNQLSRMTVALALIAFPATAHPPAELADYVGARAGQAEGGLTQLGYENAKGSYWWSARHGICVHMPVSQGRFKSVDIVKPAECGVSLKPASSGTCPVDVSEADRYKYPACN